MPRMGNPSIKKIMFAHIALLGFQRAGGFVRRFSSRPLLYTAIRLLQVIMTYFPIIFFRERIYRTPPHGDDRLSRKDVDDVTSLLMVTPINIPCFSRMQTRCAIFIVMQGIL